VIVAATPARAPDELHGGAGGDVLEHHAQSRVPRDRGREHLGDETGFAVEHVDVMSRDLAVHQQWHAELAHARQHGIDVADVRDARIRIGGRTRRIELAAVYESAGFRGVDFRGRGAVGEIQRHQRRETRMRRQRGENPCAIGARRLGGGDRRLEIWHHDGAREARGGEGQDCLHGGAVAQVQVPVVGTANFNFHALTRRIGK
jgi:hypothetical protein